MIQKSRNLLFSPKNRTLSGSLVRSMRIKESVMNFDNLKCAAGNGISEFYLVPTRIVMEEKTENAEYLLAERPRQASFAPPENSCLIKKD